MSMRKRERESSIATVGSATPQARDRFHLANIRDRNSLLSRYLELFPGCFTEHCEGEISPVAFPATVIGDN